MQDGRLDSPAGECLCPPWDGRRENRGNGGVMLAARHRHQGKGGFPFLWPCRCHCGKLSVMLWLIPGFRLYLVSLWGCLLS